MCQKKEKIGKNIETIFFNCYILMDAYENNKKIIEV
jgi:hypothetical protein